MQERQLTTSTARAAPKHSGDQGGGAARNKWGFGAPARVRDPTRGRRAADDLRVPTPGIQGIGNESRLRLNLRSSLIRVICFRPTPMAGPALLHFETLKKVKRQMAMWMHTPHPHAFFLLLNLTQPLQPIFVVVQIASSVDRLTRSGEGKCVLLPVGPRRNFSCSLRSRGRGGCGCGVDHRTLVTDIRSCAPWQVERRHA